MALPVAVKLATVGEVPEQNIWVALPVGTEGVALTVAVTSNLEVLSQPLIVWLA
jgi:hypothetical protein